MEDVCLDKNTNANHMGPFLEHLNAPGQERLLGSSYLNHGESRSQNGCWHAWPSKSQGPEPGGSQTHSPPSQPSKHPLPVGHFEGPYLQKGSCVRRKGAEPLQLVVTKAGCPSSVSYHSWRSSPRVPPCVSKWGAAYSCTFLPRVSAGLLLQ